MQSRNQTWVKIKLAVMTIAGIGLLATLGYIYQQSRTAATPKVPAATTQIDPITFELHNLSDRQKVAALLMLHVSGTNTERMVEFVKTYQPGGLILMGDNISSDITQIRALTTKVQEVAQPYALFIATDEEGCKVKRLPQDNFACAKDLGSQSPQATEKVFLKRSQLLDQAGINLNFGIVADITNNPDSFIYPRVFGADPKHVSDHVAAAVKGSTGVVYTTVKHFPGHGLTEEDSHKTIPVSDVSKADWLNQAAPPFQAAIRAKVEAVMFSHLIYSQIDDQPASLSKEWHDVLTQEFGFKGLMVTDDLIMVKQSGDSRYQNTSSNVIAAINAGNSIVLMVNDHRIDEQPQTIIDLDVLLDEVVAAVEDGRISKDHLNDLVYRSLSQRSKIK